MEPNDQHIFNRFPVLMVGEDYVLRQPAKGDAQAYFDYINHPDVAPYIPDSCLPENLEKAANDLQYMRDLYNRRRSIYWVIVEKQSQTLVGSIGFENWIKHHHRAELAYDIDPAFWRQGIATRTILTVLNYAFTRMHVQRIEAYTLPHNTPSNRCLEKLHFNLEATLNDYRFYKGEFTDILLYALTKPVYDNHATDYQKRLASYG